MRTSQENTDQHILVLNILTWLLALAFALLATVLGAYLYRFRGPLSDSHEQWAQFGDFIGGTLNPLFAFLSLIALVLTVSMQRRQLEIAREQLENSRQELEATRAELQRAADAQVLLATAQGRQAESSATGTRLAALTATLAVVDSLVKDARTAGIDRDDEIYTNLLEQRKRLLSAVFEITNEQLQRTAA